MEDVIYRYDGEKHVRIRVALKELQPGCGMVIPRSEPTLPSPKTLKAWVNVAELRGAKMEVRILGEGADIGGPGDWLIWCVWREDDDLNRSGEFPLPAGIPFAKSGRPQSAITAALEAMELYDERAFEIPAEGGLAFVNRLRVSASTLGKMSGTHYATRIEAGLIRVVRTKEKL